MIDEIQRYEYDRGADFKSRVLQKGRAAAGPERGICRRDFCQPKSGSLGCGRRCRTLSLDGGALSLLGKEQHRDFYRIFYRTLTMNAFYSERTEETDLSGTLQGLSFMVFFV